MLKNTIHAYGSVAKTFHWLMFLLVAGLLAAGFIMEGMELGPDKIRLYGLHKSIGIAVLALALLRLTWKAVNIAPPLPGTMRKFDKFAAQAMHWLLYAMMIAMPLSGWLMSSASGFSVSVFGWFTLPDLIAPDKETAKLLRAVHGWAAWGIIAMVTLHAGAALLHHFYYKDNVLKRMLPFARVE